MSLSWKLYFYIMDYISYLDKKDSLMIILALIPRNLIRKLD